MRVMVVSQLLCAALVLSACTAPEIAWPEATPLPDPRSTAVVASVATNVNFEPVDDIPDGWPRGGTQIESLRLTECFWEGDGRWRFRGSIDGPTSWDSEVVHVVLDWVHNSDILGPPAAIGLVRPALGTTFDAYVEATEWSPHMAHSGPTGRSWDTACSAFARTEKSVFARSLHGPTSGTVAGPRPSTKGRVALAASEPPPVRADVIGPLTSFEVGQDYDLQRDVLVWGDGLINSFGPATVGIGGTQYQVPSGTPLGGCAPIHILSRLDEFRGNGARSGPCSVIAGLDEFSQIAWLTSGSGDVQIRWDPNFPNWENLFISEETVRIDPIAEIRTDSVVWDTGIAIEVPLDPEADIRCDQTDDIPWAPESLGLSFRTEAILDVESGLIVALECVGRFSG